MRANELKVNPYEMEVILVGGRTVLSFEVSCILSPKLSPGTDSRLLQPSWDLLEVQDTAKCYFS